MTKYEQIAQNYNASLKSKWGGMDGTACDDLQAGNEFGGELLKSYLLKRSGLLGDEGAAMVKEEEGRIRHYISGVRLKTDSPGESEINEVFKMITATAKSAIDSVLGKEVAV